MPHWHDGPISALDAGAETPLVWSVAIDDPVAEEAERDRLACALIARVTGVDVAAVRLGRSATGAPLVVAPEGWHLSRSGRGQQWLIGIARLPIAVDREPLDDQPPLWDMLSAAEANALRATPVPEQPHEWLRRWTIKEAHAKLTGNPRPVRPEAIETELHDAVRATATFAGASSRCWSRRVGDAIETVALWA